MSGPNSKLVPIGFSDLANWVDDDHLAAFKAFLNTAQRINTKPYSAKKLCTCPEKMAHISHCALKANIFDAGAARLFFETYFQPFLIVETGHLTGYYEPIIAASRVKNDEYSFPLLARPDDLIDISDENRPPRLPADMRFARLSENGDIVPYFTRSEIEGDDAHNGVLSQRNLAIAYVRDPIDAYFVHIQGSARLQMATGEKIAITYAAKAGHEYKSIGKRLIEIGELTPDNVSMSALRKWFADNPKRRTEITWHNPSYIFFEDVGLLDENSGPIAAAKVQLSAGRSLAVDRLLHSYGTPIWIEIENAPSGICDCSNRLTIAQDTGSAIIGAARGDLFVGSGAHEGVLAGQINHKARFVALLPKAECQ